MAAITAGSSYAPDLDKPVMRIGAVADLLGVCIRTVRIYEERGLVQPARRNNQRLYSFNDVRWLGHLRRLANEADHSLDELARLVCLPACWILMDCPQEARARCPMAKSRGKRCWEVTERRGRCADCRTCQIYRIAAGEDRRPGRARPRLQGAGRASPRRSHRDRDQP